MNPAGEFFLKNIDVVFFFYGLSFFCMGLAVFLEAQRSFEYDFARSLRPLAIFGLVHGSHEWFEMLLIAHPEITNAQSSAWISLARIILLAVSFIFLVDFGAALIAGAENKQLHFRLLGSIALLWLSGLVGVFILLPPGNDRVVAADVYTRYSLAIPGAALTAWGLTLQRQKFFQVGLRNFGNDLAIAALAFLGYGLIGQLFASPSAIFPSHYLNTEIFLRWFGFPVQLFRAAMATVVAIFIIRSLRSFEVENTRRIESLREAQLLERRQLEQIRGELLHRTVKAQEMERQRIARELHDETGQMLTGLGLGLRGLAATIPVDPQRAIQQANQLEGLATRGIEELQRMVGGLHPPQLDELGLLAALRWFASEISDHSQMDIRVSGAGAECELPDEVRVVFFRVAQEAITNAARHANATQVVVQLDCSPEKLNLVVQDNGIGFNVEDTLNDMATPHWGLLGMLERATLIQGVCKINSTPTKGTQVSLEWTRSPVYE